MMIGEISILSRWLCRIVDCEIRIIYREQNSGNSMYRGLPGGSLKEVELVKSNEEGG